MFFPFLVSCQSKDSAKNPQQVLLLINPFMMLSLLRLYISMKMVLSCKGEVAILEYLKPDP